MSYEMYRQQFEGESFNEIARHLPTVLSVEVMDAV